MTTLTNQTTVAEGVSGSPSRARRSRLTPFEIAYLCAEPFLLPLHKKVRRRLLELSQMYPSFEVLDVGGRKSPYSIGVPGRVTISDLRRTSELQRELNLGLDQQLIDATRARRSNVCDIIIDDMIRSRLPDHSFDCVVAVEVLEHVEHDALFVREVHRVLRPGGTFLMTTPNGDCVPNKNPDHRRHYTRAHLNSLLFSFFEWVDVEYAVQDSPSRRKGLASWSLAHPLQTLSGMIGNLINTIESAPERLSDRSNGTRHLIATARR